MFILLPPNENRLLIGRFIYLIVLFLIASLSACQPNPAPIPSDTPTQAAPTETATPTIVWFPPTATWTPFPTLTKIPPTPEQRPGIGEVLLEDDFTDKDAWLLTEKEGGSARIGKNEITFVTSKKRVYIQSIRQAPVLTNFYLETTVNPIFCQPMDEYGILLRIDSVSDYYRYSVSCDGQVRLDRILGGNASSPQPWLASGSVPQGGPSLFRLGVWVVGSEFRFFVNDDYQFTIRDGQIPSGTVGYFARSSTDDPFTVNFRLLKIWKVNP